MYAFPMAVAWLIAVTNVSAFQSTAPLQRRQHSHSQSDRHFSIVHQSTQDAQEDDEEEYEMVEFFVSPEQISFLRKEAIKRDSRKKLPKCFLPTDESRDVSQETINEVVTLFDTSELIELRGVSKDAKKQVFDAAYGLAATLEDTIGKPVVVVDIKGFAAKLYCPWDDDEREKRIQLRTSYKPGQWTNKAKPIRDNRGQVIMDENGKSVKAIPE